MLKRIKLVKGRIVYADDYSEDEDFDIDDIDEFDDESEEDRYDPNFDAWVAGIAVATFVASVAFGIYILFRIVRRLIKFAKSSVAA